MSLYQPAADFILLLLLVSHVNSDYDRAPLFRSNQNQQDFRCQGPQHSVRRPITFSDPAARRTALQHPSSFPTSTLTSGGRCQYRRDQLSVRLPFSPAASSLDRPCTPYLSTFLPTLAPSRVETPPPRTSTQRCPSLSSSLFKSARVAIARPFAHRWLSPSASSCLSNFLGRRPAPVRAGRKARVLLTTTALGLNGALTITS